MLNYELHPIVQLLLSKRLGFYMQVLQENQLTYYFQDWPCQGDSTLYLWKGQLQMVAPGHDGPFPINTLNDIMEAFDVVCKHLNLEPRYGSAWELQLRAYRQIMK